MSFISRSSLRSSLPPAAWALSGLVLLAAGMVWGQRVGWQLAGLSAYSLFPLFGLAAFSLMWGHYMVTAAWKVLGADRTKLNAYYNVTSWIVLIALLLHPGLLVWRLWADGFGLPPNSYLTHYVAPELGWVAGLGATAWLAFLAFELYRWLGQKPWWRWVSWASEFAMIAIFYHALRLGGELQVPWFRALWIAYGVSLVAVFAFLHWHTYRSRRDPQPWRVRGAVVGVGVVMGGVSAVVSALLA